MLAIGDTTKRKRREGAKRRLWDKEEKRQNVREGHEEREKQIKTKRGRGKGGIGERKKKNGGNVRREEL